MTPTKEELSEMQPFMAWDEFAFYTDKAWKLREKYGYTGAEEEQETGSQDG